MDNRDTIGNVGRAEIDVENVESRVIKLVRGRPSVHGRQPASGEEMIKNVA